ncbi:hypothetical protein [Bifidobacterium saguinibicoloris]|uniref:hypothetical protein n=1 Tax=Bifidobacterium saguinibicoloris TaxID=2834433 RepID=UPI001C58C5BE|nr:hypothetical protein [Bifidobacterium saguinibicoloris]MBW3081417.1 hypothetical protein [Bifidobacterium saguinibicoloris]
MTTMDTRGSLTGAVRTESPKLQMDGGDFDGLYRDGDGGEEHFCEWDEGMCDEVASYYVISFCDDPDCKADHKQYYCMRHYALELARKLEHLRECPGYDDADTADARRLVTLRHIADWGHLTGIR